MNQVNTETIAKSELRHANDRHFNLWRWTNVLALITLTFAMLAMSVVARASTTNPTFSWSWVVGYPACPPFQTITGTGTTISQVQTARFNAVLGVQDQCGSPTSSGSMQCSCEASPEGATCHCSGTNNSGGKWSDTDTASASCPNGYDYDSSLVKCVPHQCPTGFQRVLNGDCLPVINPYLNLGDNPNNNNSSEPINSATGNNFQKTIDYSSATKFGLKFTRYYNSDSAVQDTHLGAHWRDSFDRSISISGDTARVFRADGVQYTFTKTNGAWVSDDANNADILTGNENNGVLSGWTYKTHDNITEQYDATGRLTSITPLGGPTTTLSYDSSGHLAQITDAFGHSLSFTYDSTGRIASMTNPAGDVTLYGYDSANNLTVITHPDGTTRQYLYNEAAQTGGVDLPHALTGLIDEDGDRYVTWTYDAKGRATSSTVAGSPAVTMSYNSDGTTTITDELGAKRTYTFTNMFGVAKISSETKPYGSGTATLTRTYDDNGYLASQTDWNGNVTKYTHDAKGRELSRTEAVGTPQERTITTEWDTTLNLPLKVTSPGRVTTFTYDAQGRMLTRTVQAGTETRTVAYTYNDDGLVTSVDGPRTDVNDVTSFGYDSEGNLVSVTNALGQTTNITAYDASGLPLSYIDPNGLVSNLTYDTRGRLVSKDTGGEAVSLGYDGVGDITSITLPSGDTISYGYDQAHQLTGVTDSAGNHIAYTLDAIGNRTSVQITDPNGSLTRVQNMVYDQLSQLIKSIGANSQTTSYDYDADGNRTSVTDPNGHTTSNSFDALNRLVQQIDPLNNKVSYGYDNQDHLVSVTDALGHTTSYTYDGLGNLLKRVSPDTGTTTYTHDSAGDVTRKTDAKGQTTTYTYDALNRMTQTTYDDGSTVVYTYGNCANGIGHLCSTSDGTNAISWSYDTHGRITSRTNDITVDKKIVVLTTSYGYDSAGRLNSMTYPSGLTVAYHYKNNRLTDLDLNGESYISNATYAPFGPVTGWTWGNGSQETRTYNQDGRLIKQSLGSDQRTLSYDKAGNITSITDPHMDWSYGYDALNRLTSAANSVDNSSLGWQYDGNGNRLSQDSNGTNTAYGYDPSSNRLTSVGQTPYTYDADGNTVNDGKHSYGYNARNRLVTVDGGDTATYTYNGLGQRVLKEALLPVPMSAMAASHANTHALANTANTIPTTVIFAYDQAGRLIGEYDKKGEAIEETVYFGALPISTVRSGTPYAIHSDQLGTPRVITDSSNTVVWRWNSNPFGVSGSNETSNSKVNRPGFRGGCLV